MLLDVVEARYMGEYRVYLAFEDGTRGVADLADCAQDQGVFLPLRDPEFFGKLTLDPKLGTICWPNGADLAPEFLYARVTQTAASKEH